MYPALLYLFRTANVQHLKKHSLIYTLYSKNTHLAISSSYCSSENISLDGEIPYEMLFLDRFQKFSMCKTRSWAFYKGKNHDKAIF